MQINRVFRLAVLLAAAEGLSSGLRVSRRKKPSTVLFNGAVMACSTSAMAASRSAT